MTPGEWTPARVDLLRAEYASAEDNRALLDRINALDGAPIASVKSLGLKASKLGLMKTASAMAAIWARQAEAGRSAMGAGRPAGRTDTAPRKPRVVAIKPDVVLLGSRGAPPSFRKAPPKPAKLKAVEQPSEDPGIRRYQRARALIAQGKDPYAVAAAVGLPAWRCLGIKGEIGRERVRG